MSEQTVADQLVSLAKSDLDSALKNVAKKFAELGFINVLTAAANSAKETVLRTESMMSALTQIALANAYDALIKMSDQQVSVERDAIKRGALQLIGIQLRNELAKVQANFISVFENGASADFPSAVAKYLTDSGSLGDIAKKILGGAVGALATYKLMDAKLDQALAAGEPPEKAAEIIAKTLISTATTSLLGLSTSYKAFVDTGVADLRLRLLGLSEMGSIETLGSARFLQILSRAGIAGAALTLSFEGGYWLGGLIHDTWGDQIDRGVDWAVATIQEQFTNSSSNDAYPSQISTIAVLINRIDPKFTTDDLNAVLKASAPTFRDLAELSALHNSLRKLFFADMAEDKTRTPETFFNSVIQTLAALKKNYPGQTFSIVSLVDKSASDLLSSAQTDIAYRYALVNLNSFAVEGFDYSRFNGAGQLNLLDPDTGRGLSSAWLQARATMLSWKMLLDGKDKITSWDQPYNDGLGTPTAYFEDQETGTRIYLGQPEWGQTNRAHYVFGASGQTLSGGDLSDSLFAGDGVETLSGGAGDDYLEAGHGEDVMDGGKGNDTYQLDALKAMINTTDTIKDADGKGTIWLGNTQLKGGNATGANFQWKGSDGTLYQFQTQVAGGLFFNGEKGTLTISGANLGANDRIVIDNFDLSQAQSASGYLGIKLGSAKVSLVAGASQSANPFAQGNFGDSTPAAAAASGDASLVTAFVSAISDKVQTIALALSGGDASGFEIDLGDGNGPVAFSGSVNLVVPAGQDSVSFDLINTADVSSPEAIDLTATLADPDNSAAASSTLEVDYTATQFKNPKTASVIEGQSYGAYTLYQGDGADDLITVGSGPNEVNAGDGNDSITGGGGNDTITAGSGNSVIVGGGGRDLISVSGGSNRIFVTSPTDIQTAIAQAKSGTGSSSPESVISTGNGNNTIVGGNGTDLIAVGSGSNLVVLGSGTSHFMGGVKGDTARIPNDWTLTIATNSNYVAPYNWSWYMPVWLTDVEPSSYQCSASYEGCFLYELDNPLNRTASGLGNDTIIGGSGQSLIYLSNGNNDVELGSGASSVVGGMGDNTVYGGSGSLVFIGGGGSDYVDGGTGNAYLVGRGGDNTIFGGSGNDTIFAGDSYYYGTSEVPSETIWANGETGNNYVEGGSGDDIIFGAGGNDTLIAGSGNTTIYGGVGNEEISAGGDGQDVLYSGNGNDTIGADGAGHCTISGGSGSDTIYGSDEAATTILAGSGNELIYVGDGGTADDPTQVTGGSGSDTIYGGDGVQQITGGSGTTVIYVGNGGTAEAPAQVTAGSGATTIYGGGGDGVLDASAASSAYLVGGGADDTLKGGAGNDTLVAGSGTDYLAGGGGSNTYQFGQASGDAGIKSTSRSDVVQFQDVLIADVTATAGIGTDGQPALVIDYGAGTVTIDGGLTGAIQSFAFDDGTLTLEQLMALPTTQSNDVAGANGDLHFGAGGNQTLTGGTGSDSIVGWGGSNLLVAGNGNTQIVSQGVKDTLVGGAGNDTLVSARGNSTLIGGTGNTTFVVSTLTDVLQPVAGATNTVQSSVNFALPENVQNLVLTGDGDLRGTGNDLANVITANAGNDTLVAGSGPATLVGGAGNDTFVINNPNDVIVLPAKHGTYTIESSFSYVLPASVQNLTLTGNADLTATGNDLANVITANAGNDTLIAGTGLATLVGGIGNDTFVVNNSNDVIVEQPGWGTSKVLSSVNYVLPDQVQNLTLTGSSDLEADGNAQSNVITGNSGNDTLYGGGGSDTLIGGSGHNTYLMKSGMGLATVLDDASQGSTIQLSDGLSLTDLTGTRQGNDLVVEIAGLQSGLRFTNYFTGTRTLAIVDANGNTESPQDLLSATSAATGDQLAQLWNGFYGRLTRSIDAMYSQTKTLHSDGSLTSRYAGTIYGSVLTNTLQATHTFVPGGGTYGLNDETIVIKRVDSAAVSAVFRADDPTWEATTNQYAWLNVAWQQGATTVGAGGGASGSASSGTTSYVYIPSVPGAPNSSHGGSGGYDYGTFFPVYSGSAGGSSGSTTLSGSLISQFTTTQYTGTITGLGAQPPSGSGSPPSAVWGTYVAEQQTIEIQKITVGSGDHTVYANYLSFVVAGDGNDAIYNAGFAIGGSGNDTLVGTGVVSDAVAGGTLIGGSGNDILANAGTMVAGSGNDQIFTAQDAATIVIDPAKVGTALIGGQGVGSEAFLAAYYRAAGIADWQERYQHAGLYYSPLLGDGGYWGDAAAIRAVYDNEAYLQAYNEQGYAHLGIQQLLDAGVIHYVAPLPMLAVTKAGDFAYSDYYKTNPVTRQMVSANDYAFLDPCFAKGLLPAHKVVFAAGVGVSDLHLSWGLADTPLEWQGAASPHTTLNISWDTNHSVQVIIPHSDDPIGSGVTEFDFADGTRLSMSQMMAMAPSAPSLDPESFLFEAGMGQQTIDASQSSVSFAAGIAPSAVTVSRDGVDLLLSANAGADVLRIPNWYADPTRMPTISADFADNATWDSTFLTTQGLTVDGSAGNETLTGLAGFTNVLIGGPSDTLIAGGTNDTFVFNRGSGQDTIVGAAQAVPAAWQCNAIQFGAGIAASSIRCDASGNDLLVSYGTQGDSILLKDFEVDSANGRSQLKFVLADGTTATYNDDGHGDTVLSTFSAAGAQSSAQWRKADGSYGSDVFNSDGSASGSEYNADGSHSTYIVDTAGDKTTLNFDAQGDKIGDTWQKADGSHGSDIFNADGSSTGTASLAGGSYSQYVNDGQGRVTSTDFDAAGTEIGYRVALTANDGSVTTTRFDVGGTELGYSVSTHDGQGDAMLTDFSPSGTELADSWTKADGSHGEDTFNADGSSNGAAYLADGTSSTYANDGHGTVTTTQFDTGNSELGYTVATTDGQGNTLAVDYDPTGWKLDDAWVHADGTHGADTFYDDGSSDGTAYAADSSYSTYTTDGLGDIVTSQFDSAGMQLGDSWQYSDGSHGADSYNADGSDSGVSHYGDGTYSLYSMDAQGNYLETGYAANGTKTSDNWSHADGTWGSDTFNADGSSSGTAYNADGSYSTYSNDGKGDITTSSYAADGTLISTTTGSSNNVLVGGPNQTVTATAAGQTLVAGLNDTLVGAAAGGTTFTIARGEGTVVVDAAGSGNTLQFGAGIAASQVSLGIGSLLLRLDQAGDVVHIEGFDPASAPGSGTVQNFAFADGTTLSYAQLLARGFDIYGTSGNETLTGTNLDNRIHAGSGNDLLIASGAHDTLYGGAGNDTLVGGNGADLLIAGTGTTRLVAGTGGNTLTGGSGADTFVFTPGDGNDLVIDTRKSVGDVIEFGAGVSAQNLSLTTAGADLQIHYGSQGDSVVVQNFNPAGDGKLTVDRFQYADGSFSTYANDGLGDTMLTSFAAGGTRQADLWAKADGSHGSDTFKADGSSSGVAIASDGSSQAYANDGQGTVTTSVFNAGGTKIGDTWSKADGSSGTDTFNTDGSVASATVALGGSSHQLIWGDANVTVTGGSGNDSIVLGGGHDQVTLGDGNDTVIGGGSIVIAAGNGNDWLQGGSGPSYLSVGSGSDTLVAGSGVATLVGGAGNDVFVINNTADIVQAKAGATNTIQTSVSYAAAANVQNMTATGTAAVTLTGNSLANVITANSGNDTLVAGSGVATLIGGAGNDTFVVNNTVDVVQAQAGGINTIQTLVSYTASTNVQALTGTGTGNIVLTGNNLADIITGNSGNDTLIAGSGVATLIGGTGNDVFVINNTADVVQAKAGTVNTIQTSVSYTASANVQNLTGTGSAALTLTGNTLANVITANSGDDTLVAGSGVATLIGGTGNDTFVVNNVTDVVQAQAGGANTIQTSVSYTAGANVRNLVGTGTAALTLTANNQDMVITGNSGADKLVAGSGNDTLIAGTGVATLVGGTGNDTFVINNTADVVQAQAGGINTIQTSVSYTAGANVQYLTGTGSANLTLTGNTLNDVITGNAGTDKLVAGSGNDTLIAGSGVATLVGGTGSNTFVVNNTADVVTANSTAVLNTILSSVSYTASANVKNLTGTGTANLTLTGNTLADTISANSGNDTLVAGSGVATLIGGAGSDTFVVNNTADIVQAQAGGVNTIQTSVSYTASANVQNLTATGTTALTLTGNSLANVITANSGNDTLVAGTGVATLVGGAGSDTFVVNNVADVVQAQSTGTNTIQTSVNYTASANVKKLTGTGTGNLVLTGNSLADTITANNGNDTLVAGSGVATLVGGTGSDVFVVNNTADVVQAKAGAVNTILTSVSYTAAANVQNLTGTGTAALTLTGNTVANVITANSGNDTLVAGSGVATLIGGAGNDTFVVNNVNDVVQAQAGGTNAIQTSVSYTAAANVQNLTATGTAAVTLTGNSLANVITANSGNDTLVAGSGVATLVGGAGSDTFVVNNVADVVQAQGTGTNTIQTSVSYTASANVKKLTGTGTGNLVLTGNGLADTITANSGNDTLVAGSGVATLVGGTGNDTFVVNNTADVVQAQAGAALNTLMSSVSYTASANVQDLILTGSANLSGTGNTGNDLIVANSGNDTLTGGAGTNVLEGGIGADTLREAAGKAALLGGAGADAITVGTGVCFIDGGAGNDAITLSSAIDVIGFNAGGGQDVITAGTGMANVLSLGGGIDYANLAFSKSGNNLILSTGGGDSITFANWYSATSKHDFVTLQMVEKAAASYNPASSNVLDNQAIEEFDFGKLVTAFNTALAANPSLSSWSLMNGLLSAHLSGSDTAALGGDLAYYDGLNGNLSGLNLAAAVTTLQNTQFGKTAQTVDAWSGVSNANPIR